MTFRCIRHRLLGFVASGTVILFLHVFFDYTGGDDISLHPARLFSSCMSFLTTQEGFVATGTVILDVMNATNFFRRDYVFLNVEEKDLLEDWELVLCDKSALESVALLPRLRRCFNRVDSFITERAEAIKKLACKNLETALRRKHMLQFPMSTFTRIFLERYKNKLETEQVEALSMWSENLCALSKYPRPVNQDE